MNRAAVTPSPTEHDQERDPEKGVFSSVQAQHPVEIPIEHFPVDQLAGAFGVERAPLEVLRAQVALALLGQDDQALGDRRVLSARFDSAADPDSVDQFCKIRVLLDFGEYHFGEERQRDHFLVEVDLRIEGVEQKANKFFEKERIGDVVVAVVSVGEVREHEQFQEDFDDDRRNEQREEHPRQAQLAPQRQARVSLAFEELQFDLVDEERVEDPHDGQRQQVTGH